LHQLVHNIAEYKLTPANVDCELHQIMWWLHRLGRNIDENKLMPANVDCELHYLVVAPNYVVVASSWS
jgi:hypothetical protein